MPENATELGSAGRVETTGEPAALDGEIVSSPGKAGTITSGHLIKRWQPYMAANMFFGQNSCFHRYMAQAKMLARLKIV